MNPLLLCDFYKIDHRRQYPEGTTLVYSNFTPRKSRNLDVNKIIFFGLQYFVKAYLIKLFDDCFFDRELQDVLEEMRKIIEPTVGKDFDYSHIRKLHDLGYLPLEIKGLPEGALVPMGVPVLTIKNTHADFFWLTSYIESLMSSILWGACTSATTAYQYRKVLRRFAGITGADMSFVDFQGHDFSFRGMFGCEAAHISGAAHLLSFKGTDTIPAISLLKGFYGVDNDKELIGCSVPATEHSVMCAGGKENELETFKRLITEVYPSGIVSIVSDTWDLWNVIENYLPQLKEIILARDGKLVIRPDSGDPVDIICGDDCVQEDGLLDASGKGVIQLLWDIFGGTINEEGYKVLDSHIGVIYGDSITLERCKEICEILMQKGFCSSNIVFGIGSYTYQYVTRDNFSFAMKSTYIEVNGEGREIFKDPITDSGEKKSAKGLLLVETDDNGNYKLYDQVSEEAERSGLLETVFKDGKLIKETTLTEIRSRINDNA